MTTKRFTTMIIAVPNGHTQKRGGHTPSQLQLEVGVDVGIGKFRRRKDMAMGLLKLFDHRQALLMKCSFHVQTNISTT